MLYMHPAAGGHLRERWTHPDADRFAPPGSPEARRPGHLHAWAEVARREQAAEAEAKTHAAFAADLESLRASHARVRIMLADVKFELALRRIFQIQPRPAARAGGQSGWRAVDGWGREQCGGRRQ